MKRSIMLLSLMLTAITLLAIPAKRVTKEITTINGAKIQATLTGDENLHFWLGDDGKRYIQNDDNQYVEFETDKFNVLKTKAINKRTLQNNQRSKRAKALRYNASTNLFNGSKKGLVILVNFSDKQMNAANTQTAFNNMFNQEGYNKGGHIGSVHDFFKDQSYGAFDLTFDVVGPVTVSQKYSYYGKNNEDDEDSHPAEMVIEACKLADSKVNFKDYDWDGDGYVDQVYVIFAGYTEAQGGDDNTIWAHEYNLYAANYYGDGTGVLTLDGVKINTYACSSELRGSTGTTISPIGTACHEFSHCLGYPDLYDTDYSGGFGMDAWDIMSGGSYNGPYGYGEVPAGYNAFERQTAGWLTFTELNKAQRITNMKALSDSPEAYIIYNDANKNEFYILENRQQKSWDSYQYGHGMLVIHVDYDSKVWAENAPNDDPSHQRFNIIPADNQFMSGYDATYGSYATSSDLAGDPFPGTKKVTALTDTSTPAATLFNKNTDGRKFMGKPIEDITESAGLISFKFMGGIDLNAPTAKEATNIAKDKFTAQWTGVEKADSYTIELKEVSANVDPESSLLLNEDFSGFSKYTSDGTADIGSSLNEYMKTSGWTGTKVYTSKSRVKIGSSKSNGYITTPSITTPTSGTYTVAFTAQGYSSSANVTVKVNDESVSVTSTENTYVVQLKNITADTKIKIAPGARAYISSVKVYDGEFTAEQLASETETAVGDVKTITNITDTCYTFTELTGEAYTYRVKSVNSEGESSWSKSVKVDLSSASLLGDINLDNNINIGDLTQLIGLVMENYATKDELFTRADLNSDNNINVGDVTILINLIMSFEAQP